MIIIATGMDNTGKTTLCNKLTLQSGWDLKKSPGPGLSVENKRKWTLHALGEDQVIYDRFLPIEELVYGVVLRQGRDIPYTKEEVIELLSKAEVKIIYTRPTRDKIFDFGSRPQMPGVIFEAASLLNQWDTVMEELFKAGIEVIKYDYENPVEITIPRRKTL